MSAVEQLPTVDMLIPDGIEPVEAMRCWTLRDGTLRSLNSVPWTPGQALVARCNASGGQTYSWAVVRHGESREQAAARADHINAVSAHGAWIRIAHAWCPRPPSLELPDGYGLALETKTHDSPDDRCACGIYAATTKKQLPEDGDVYGKVKLWGKVVPGERGVRAQYAYPSEFHVSPDLADDPTLKAFGVPIIVNRDAPAAAAGIASLPSGRTGMHPLLKVATAANFAACALNLSLLGLHLS